MSKPLKNVPTFVRPKSPPPSASHDADEPKSVEQSIASIVYKMGLPVLESAGEAIVITRPRSENPLC